MSKTERIIKRTAHVNFMGMAQVGEVQTMAFECGADLITASAWVSPIGCGLYIEFSLTTTQEQIDRFVKFVRQLGYFNIYTAEVAKTVFASA